VGWGDRHPPPAPSPPPPHSLTQGAGAGQRRAPPVSRPTHQAQPTHHPPPTAPPQPRPLQPPKYPSHVPLQIGLFLQGDYAVIDSGGGVAKASFCAQATHDIAQALQAPPGRIFVSELAPGQVCLCLRVCIARERERERDLLGTISIRASLILSCWVVSMYGGCMATGMKQFAN